MLIHSGFSSFNDTTTNSSSVASATDELSDGQGSGLGTGISASEQDGVQDLVLTHVSMGQSTELTQTNMGLTGAALSGDDGWTEQFLSSVGGQVLIRDMASLIKGDAMPSAMASRWSEFVAEVGVEKAALVDINALVQAVLREAYMENTKDLHFYAQKVKFFNEVKKAIRDELTKARDYLTNYAGADDTTELSPPYMPVEIQTEYMGQMEVSEHQVDVNAEWNQYLIESNRATGDAWLETRTSSESSSETSFWSQDPLIIDLDGDGVETQMVDDENFEFIISQGTDVVTGGVQSGSFDSDGNGSNDSNRSQTTTTTNTTTEFNEWVGADDGLLVMDRNGDGQIQAGDLFGDSSVTGRNAANGYEDLAALDTNGDGKITSADQNFSELRVWQDANSDGNVDAGEMMTLEEAGVQELYLAYTQDSDPNATVQQHSGYRSTAADGIQGDMRAAGAILTKGELDTYIQGMEEKLNSVGDDAQLANVDLQNMLQKQQQTLQMMSNISKMLHDTAMAVVRKIGG